MTNPNNPYGGFGFNSPSFGDTMKGCRRQKSVLNYLLVINVAIWIMVAFANLFLWLYKSPNPNVLVKWLSVPADLSVLAHRPWTVVTYMVLHERFWHLFFNMWMLWFGGMIFTRFLSGKQLAWTYVLGGLTGAVFFILAYNIFPVFETAKHSAVALGASASVLAILVAAAAYKPDYGLHLMLLGQLKFKWLAIALVVIDLLSISADNPGGHIAHLGGALFGFVYGLLLRNDFKLKGVFHFPRRKPKMEYTPYEEIHDEPEVPRSDEEYNRQKAEKEHNIDVILDKIAKSGYGSLTQEEKEYLFKNSR
jgi:membrane associated rhomboid family serine protease